MPLCSQNRIGGVITGKIRVIQRCVEEWMCPNLRLYPGNDWRHRIIPPKKKKGEKKEMCSG
jgi:hypothetical protein